jgi:DNA-binding transcriptional LysR family regulator
MALSVQKLLNRLSLRQLQIFAAVYEQRGYSKAADMLGLSQPAVSAQLKHLEEALDVKLFEFVGRKLYRTPAADKVHQSVSLIFDEIKRLQDELHSLEGVISGDLTLTAVNTAQYITPYLLKPFLAKYPLVNVRLHVVNRAQAIERLNRNEGDLVIMGIVPSEKPFASLPFLDNELIPVMAPSHPLAEEQMITPQLFLQSGVLVRERGSGSRLALEQHCHEHGIKMRLGMEFGSNDATKHGVLAGLGVAVLPRLSVTSELRLGTLVSPDIEGFPIKRAWCVVHPSAKKPAPVARHFLDFVEENKERIAEAFRMAGTETDRVIFE